MHVLTFFSIIVFFGINFSFLGMFVFSKKNCNTKYVLLAFCLILF
jgi:hypothetical protein